MAYVHQLFGAASIQVRLLFEGGLYAMFQSAKPVKAVWHAVTRTVKAKLDFVYVKKKVFENVNKHFGILKAVKFSPTWTIAPPFSSRGFYWSAASVQLEFGESAASVFECGFQSSAAFIHDFTVLRQLGGGIEWDENKEMNTGRLKISLCGWISPHLKTGVICRVLSLFLDVQHQHTSK